MCVAVRIKSQHCSCVTEATFQLRHGMRELQSDHPVTIPWTHMRTKDSTMHVLPSVLRVEYRIMLKREIARELDRELLWRAGDHVCAKSRRQDNFANSLYTLPATLVWQLAPPKNRIQ